MCITTFIAVNKKVRCIFQSFTTLFRLIVMTRVRIVRIGLENVRKHRLCNVNNLDLRCVKTIFSTRTTGSEIRNRVEFIARIIRVAGDARRIIVDTSQSRRSDRNDREMSTVCA